jgi:ligand-binding sensor domain-containing protein
MRTKKNNRTSLLILTLALSLAGIPPVVSCLSSGPLTSFYKEGDWVALTDFRFVHSLDFDSRIVYAGTSGGVERYNYLQSAWETPLTPCDGLPHREVTVVAVDPSRGELWCGTRAGLAVYHTDLKTWRVYTRQDGLPGDEIEEIVMGESGLQGDYVFVKAAGSWARIRKGIDLIERVPAGSVPREGVGKRRGPLDPSVFGSEKYPFLSSSTEPDENLETYPITALAEDSWGSLWLGTWGGNIGSVSLVTHAAKAYRFGLASASVSALEKGDGCIWFAGGGGMSPGGITKMADDMSEWTYYEEEHERPLRGAVICDLEAASDRLWAATNLGLAGLDIEKGYWKKWGRRDGLPDDRVLCLESALGKLWVGTELGLAVVDLDSLSIRTVARLPVPLRVNDVTAGAGKVWVATDKGFFSVEEKDSSLAPLAPVGGVRAEIFGVSCFGNVVYLASWNGLYAYDAETGALSRDPHPGPVTGQRLQSIAVDGKNVWVGTDLGVERYDRESGAWVSYRPRNFELLASPVIRILPDGDHVWFASPEGVTRFFWNEPSRAR